MSTPDAVPASALSAPDPQLMVGGLAAELLQRSWEVSTAESLTGGALGDLLSAAPGASETFLGGVIAYATELKVDLLGVSGETVDVHGVVSRACAAEMADGVRSLTGADVGVSTTGVAGPTTQEGHPIGLVFVGVATPDGVTVTELDLSGDRAEIRDQTCREAVSAVLERIVGVPE